MTRFRLLFPSAFAVAFFWVSTILFAQFPPTIHRISGVDAALDSPITARSFIPSINESFGTALQPQEPLSFHAGDLLTHTPWTISLWARLSTPAQAILFHSERKNAPSFWGLMTNFDSGELSFLTKNGEMATQRFAPFSMNDRKWHFLQIFSDGETLTLYADTVKILTATWDKTLPTEADPEISFGTLLRSEFPAPLTMDEIRMDAGDAIQTVLPNAPLDVTSETDLRISFDEHSISSQKEAPQDWIAPTDSVVCTQTPLSFDTLPLSPEDRTFAIQGRLAEEMEGKIVLTSERIDHLFPTGGLEIEVKSGDHPAKEIPIQPVDLDQFDARAETLGLTHLRSEMFRSGVFSFWGEQFVDLVHQISGQMALPRGAAEQVFDPETLIHPGEKFPVEVVLRRTLDIFELLEASDSQISPQLESLRADWERLNRDVKQARTSGDVDALTLDFFLAAALRRQAMFLDPTLDGLNDILFLARGCYAGCRLTNKYNTDTIGGHMATQVYGFNSIPGGGIFCLSGWRDRDPSVRSLLDGMKVSPNGLCQRLAGEELNVGSFYKPELSYDGKTVYFSYTGSKEHRWIWTPDTTWNIFKLTLDENGYGKELTQLTDSAYNDFDVCELPSGRLVFASERRGGFIRCFAGLNVTSSVLHSMKNDGTDIYPISFFETSEWRPSVDHNGMLLYTRWDYTDRENCLGSAFWTCAPDGRNPRAPHGNYPQPWFNFGDKEQLERDPILHGDHRFGDCSDAPSGLPMTEFQFRAIPDSHRLIFTAAPHHGETFGSLCLLDLQVPDDHHASQIRRLTPYQPFPESEMDGRSQYCYGSPWPLSEDLYLCNRWEDLILLDRFGNEELLCEREILPIGYDPRLRLSEPIPFAPREKPPVIPQQTAQGEDFSNADPSATIGVVDVHIADLPLPEDRPVKRLRVIQVLPKSNPLMDAPSIGYATENTPRIPLGTVPVEEDGSAYFKAPPGKQLLFQLLDEENKAIQTMRAVAFVHPGEKLLCVGCHEPVDASVENITQKATPIAFARAPSELEPECGPVEPMTYYRRVQPILEKSCTPCHTEKNLEPAKLDYESLRPYIYYYSGGMRGALIYNGIYGGSRSFPGKSGASMSKLGSILFDENHKESISEEDRHALILWMDCNSPRLGAFIEEEAQMRGESVLPALDASDFSADPNPSL